MEQRKSIAVRYKGELNIIPIDEVLAFTSDTKYTLVHTTKTKDHPHVIEETLVSLEPTLIGFIRVHRGALVKASHLLGLIKKQNPKNGSNLFFAKVVTSEENHIKILISRRHLASVRKLLKTPNREVVCFYKAPTLVPLGLQ